ncbi:MAG: hypothetical protein RL095_2059 [Verrucomicrobiota bacterium]|jgi:flagellar M-ring protein FliF
MGETFKNFWGACLGVWRGIGLPQRISIILVFVCAAAAMASIVWYGSRENWVPLYVDIDAKDKAAVMELLRERNIPSRHADGNRSIEVPEKYAAEAKMRVAEKGIVTDADGKDPYAYYDNPRMGETEQQALKNEQRATQNDIARKLRKMPNVQDAMVTVVVPRKRAFQKDAPSATASVHLVLAGKASVTKGEVEAMRHMVAASVPGLSPDKVTITDNRGVLRAQNDSTLELGGAEGRQAELQAAYEDYYRQKAESILSPILGAGKVVAMVNCDLDFSQLQRTKESFDRDNAIATTQKTTTKNTESSSGAEAQTVGNDSNTVVDVAEPEKTAGAGSPLNKTSENTVEVSSVVPKTVEITMEKGARLRKLTVAVTIAAPAPVLGKDGKPQPVNLEERKQVLEKYRKLVASAVGAVGISFPGEAAASAAATPPARVDMVTVEEAPFQVEEVAAAGASVEDVAAQVESLMGTDLARIAGGTLLLLLLFLMHRRIFGATQVMREDLAGAGPGGAAAAALEGPAPEAKPLLEADESLLPKHKPNKQIALLKKATDDEPKAIANVIENWIAEDK